MNKSSNRMALLCLLVLGLAACSPSSTPSNVSPAYPSDNTGAESPDASAEPSAEPSAAPEPEASQAPNAIESTSPITIPPNTPSIGPESSVYDYRENFFKNYGVNPFVEADTDPLSTFSIDVDTAAYTLTRSYINSGIMPDPASVRTEEYLNFFDYQYPQPLSGAFAIKTDIAPSYFGDSSSKLVRVGIQGKEILKNKRKQAILTVAIDVSGSMNVENRLELAKQSLKLLVEELNPDDQIAIISYGNQANLVLKHTALSEKSKIIANIDSLRPEGSTNAEEGLDLAYDHANTAFKEGAINRVILCSDGVANVGATGPELILERIKAESKQGIALTTLGFGLQGFNDYLMEQLANQGDGNYAYIDNLNEAKRLLVEQLTGTLQIIAYDTKVQVAFNPDLVAQYRLMGYENRDIADEDFRNDQIDAGEVGSNHSVTALYEVRFKEGAQTGSILTVNLRYRDADDQKVKEINQSIQASDVRSFGNTSASYQLATAVAEFAEILRQSVFARDGRLEDILELAQTAQRANPDDQKIQELIGLIDKAIQISKPIIEEPKQILTQSDNPKKLPDWSNYLLKQVAGISHSGS